MSSPTDSVAGGDPSWIAFFGLCPLLAVASAATNPVAYAVAAFGVMALASITVSALDRFVTQPIRLPAFAMIGGLWTTVAVLLMQAIDLGPTERIALFAQLLVTACIVVTHRARALRAGIATATAFAAGLMLLGLLGKVLPPLATPPLMFLTAGVLLAAGNAVAAAARRAQRR